MKMCIEMKFKIEGYESVNGRIHEEVKRENREAVNNCEVEIKMNTECSSEEVKDVLNAVAELVKKEMEETKVTEEVIEEVKE